MTEYTPKFAENCYAHKVSTIATLLVSSLLTLKTGCFSLTSVCQTMHITGTS